MSAIKDIYNEIYSEHLDLDAVQLILYYEQHTDLIEVENLLPSNPDYDGIMRITADYAKALSYYGDSKKALIYLNKSDKLFKNSTSAKELVEIPVYEDLIWIRGMEYYNQRNYNLATKDFRYLVDNYPYNDKYRSWLLGVKTIRIKKYSNFIWPLFFVCIIGIFLLNNRKTSVNFVLLTVSSILFIAGITIDIFDFVMKRKIKRV